MSNIKEKSLEDLQDEFNSLTRKRNQLILDLEDATKKLVELSEKIYESSPDYVRVVCPVCNGETTIRNEENKLVKCSCYPKGYLYMKKHKGVIIIK